MERSKSCIGVWLIVTRNYTMLGNYGNYKMHKGHSFILFIWVRVDRHVCNVVFIENADVVQNAAGNNNAWDLCRVTHLNILQLSESSFEQPECHFNHNARARVTVVEVTLVCSEVTVVAVWW